jgi:putative transposase
MSGREGRHKEEYAMASTLTNLLYHVVFSTKGRRPLIKPPFSEELYKYIGGIIRGERGVLLEIGGIDDHVHLVAKFRADISVADMVRDIKANSSKWAHERKTRIARFGWQTGYGAFSVSQSQLEKVRGYVRRQATHHRRISYQEEFVRLLQKHGIEYDERYLWT